MKLSICNWNILADCYVRGQNVEQTIANKAVSPTSWKYRSQLIRQILTTIRSDVYCLQEVDHYADFYRPLFHEMGYHSHYLPRPGGKRDGCLIAYPMNRFDAIEIEEVDLDRLAYLDHLERGDMQGGRFALRSKYAKQNVALFVFLQEKKEFLATNPPDISLLPTPATVILATCHIHWNPNLPEVKFAQTQLVLEELSRFQKRCRSNLPNSQFQASQASSPMIPMILSGDFNSFPHDDLYALVTGKITLLPQQHFLLNETTTDDQTNPSSSSSFKALNRGGRKFLKPLYGPNTKFLCDYSLSKLCRWMRILGIDVAMDSWENSRNAKSVVESPLPSIQSTDEAILEETEVVTSTEVKFTEITSSSSPSYSSPSSQIPLPTSTSSTTAVSASQAKKSSIQAFFERARKEKRVILTSSKTLLERTLCPPSFYVHPNKLEESLIHLYAEYGLDLRRERFLTVCGKCGGEIEELEDFLSDPRLMGKVIPSDRQIYACIQCAQPYWWNDEENSSPAKAMRKAEGLYRIITKGLALLSTDPAASEKQSGSLEEQLPSLKEDDDEDDDEEAGNDKNEDEAREETESPCSKDISEKDRKAVTTEEEEEEEKVTDQLLNLREMFERRNQIISEGLLFSSTATTATMEPISQSESNNNVTTTPNTSTASRSTALIPLQSIFQEQEPGITNWSGDFQGTLDYIFLTADQISVSFAQVFPLLEKNQVLREKYAEEEIRTRIPADLFHQRIDQSQPSLTWPSDHFLLYAELVIAQSPDRKDSTMGVNEE